MEGGIYTITAPSGSQYVGSAVSFRKRWSLHLSQLRAGKHHNKALLAAFLKYGDGALTFRPIIVANPDMLLVYEQLAIDALRPKYNRSRTAGSLYGFKMSSETKAKMSAGRKGRPNTAAQLVALAAGRAKIKGMSPSVETRAKLAAAGMGRKHTAQSRAAMSLAAKSRPRSERQLAAIIANRAKAKTPEAIEKCRLTNIARMANPDVRAAMSAKMKAHHKNSQLTDAQLAALASGRIIRLQTLGVSRGTI